MVVRVAARPAADQPTFVPPNFGDPSRDTTLQRAITIVGSR